MLNDHLCRRGHSLDQWGNCECDVVMPINSFKGNYAFLSNFYPCEVELDGITYPSVENAYQAAKTLGDREGFVYATAAQSKQMGKLVELREDWEDVKLEVMLRLLVQKFKFDTLSSAATPGFLLEMTKDRELIEGNHWGDTFWGVSFGSGQNVLGKMLMAIRKRNRAIQPPWEVEGLGRF